ncbi:MAG: DUF1579 domain-containing protein [Pirellula sp.]
MNATKLFFLACVASLAWLSGPVALAQVPGPAPEHAKLKETEGTWNFILKSSDGSEGKGISVNKLECGGLWLVCDFKTDFGGMPFQGKGLDGYDPAKKKYVSVWVDSFTPAPMIFEGNYDATGKILEMISQAPGPDGKPATWRSVTTWKSADEHTFEMFLKSEGAAEQSMMVVTYRRAK